MVSSVELDKFDYLLLKLLQQDNNISLRELGEKVNLSTAAVQRRIRYLEESGVIQANVAILNPVLLNQTITVIVEVHALSTQTSELAKLKATFTAPEIQQCYYVTGEADFMLVITVTNMAAYEKLAQRLFHDNNQVKWFRSMIVMDRVKVGLQIPLP